MGGRVSLAWRGDDARGRRVWSDRGMSHPSADPASTGARPIDDLVRAVRGPEDQDGLLRLWDAVLSLEHWWFLLVGGEDDAEKSPAATGPSVPSRRASPALATIDGRPMLLVFTSAQRARGFAVAHGMVGADDAVPGAALAPQDCLDEAPAWAGEGVRELMFDVHLTGFAMPLEQLPVVAETVQTRRAGA